MKKVWIPSIGVILLIAIIGSLFLSQSRQSSDNGNVPHPTATPAFPSSSITPTAVQSPSAQANIIVTSPKAMATVTLPITIKGKARVFENQLNYRVRDVNKNILLEGGAYANSPHTGQFGDFTIQIPSLPTMRANAITIEVYDYSAKDGKEVDTVSVPVIFDPVNTIPVKAYFSSKQASQGQECTSVSPVEHHVVRTQSTARTALEELLKGPMTSEKKSGYYTNINDGVTIQKLTIVNGVAHVDFNNKLEEGIGGSCKVAAIRAQITQTLKQFPTVQDVVISINGRTEDILQP